MTHNSLQCPKCGATSTFTRHFRRIRIISAPIALCECCGEIFVDYDDACKEGEVEENDEKTCHCNECGAEISIADIGIVDADTAKEAA